MSFTIASILNDGPEAQPNSSGSNTEPTVLYRWNDPTADGVSLSYTETGNGEDNLELSIPSVLIKKDDNTYTLEPSLVLDGFGRPTLKNISIQDFESSRSYEPGDWTFSASFRVPTDCRTQTASLKSAHSLAWVSMVGVIGMWNRICHTLEMSGDVDQYQDLSNDRPGCKSANVMQTLHVTKPTTNRFPWVDKHKRRTSSASANGRVATEVVEASSALAKSPTPSSPKDESENLFVTDDEEDADEDNTASETATETGTKRFASEILEGDASRPGSDSRNTQLRLVHWRTRQLM